MLRMVCGPRLALCLLAAALCVLRARGIPHYASDCCESTCNTPLSIKRLPLFSHYKIQEAHGGGCTIKAFVLITKKGRELCYSPESKVAAEFKKALDERNAQGPKKSLA